MQCLSNWNCVILHCVIAAPDCTLLCSVVVSDMEFTAVRWYEYFHSVTLVCKILYHGFTSHLSEGWWVACGWPYDIAHCQYYCRRMALSGMVTIIQGIYLKDISVVWYKAGFFVYIARAGNISITMGCYPRHTLIARYEQWKLRIVAATISINGSYFVLHSRSVPTVRTHRKLWCYNNTEEEYKKHYRQTSNIRCTLVDNIIVNNSDVVGASPSSTTPTISSLLNYLTHGFNGLGNNNCKTRWETVQFLNLVHLY